MRSRAVRILLTLLAFGAIAAAAYLTWSVESRLARARTASSAFHTAHVTAVHEAYELRSAQQAYVAAGQSEAFWVQKATTSLEAVRAALDALTSASNNRDVHTAVEGAAQALEDFERIDQRARRYAGTGQKLLASDIIYSDGLETTGRVLASLGDAERLAREELTSTTKAARLEWMAALAAAAGLVAIALFLLAPVPSPETATPAQPAEPVRTFDLSLKPQVSAPAAPPAAAASAPNVAAKRAHDPVPGLREADLLGLASICTDLARLSDTGSLPSILERAAKSLDASGVVLWVVDPDGRELMPVAAHGYTVSVLSRLGSLSIDSENATAAAFRTGLVQTVKGEKNTEGAIAAPLVGSSGARGVMSAEVRSGGERQAARLAAATIVAAQLATLVAPPAARTQDRSSAAL